LKRKNRSIYFPLLGVIVLSCILNTFGIWWGLPSWRGWAPDELIPSIIIEGVEKHFSHGWYQVYPPFHYYVIAAFYSPFFAIHKLKGTDLYTPTVHTVLFLLGRFISVLMAAALLYVIYRCGREIFDKRASLLVSLIVSLMAPFVYYAKIANVDIPFCFWFALSILFYIRILRYQRFQDYLLFSATATLAICTKDQAYGFYILTPVAAILSDYLSRKKENRMAKLKDSFFNRKVLFSLLLAVFLFLLIQNFAFNYQGFVEHFKLVTVWANQYGRLYEHTLSGHLKMLWQTLKHLRFCFGWPLFCVCGAGLVVSLFPRKKAGLLHWLLVPGISYYAFLISLTLSNYDRYLIPLGIILAFFGGKFVSDLLQPGQKLAGLKLALISFIFIYSFFYAFSVDILMIKDSRYSAERWMKARLSLSTRLGVVDNREYLPRLEGYNWKFFWPTREHLEQINPDYIIINVDYTYKVEKNEPRYKFYLELARGNFPYKLEWNHKSRSKLVLLNLEGIYTNLDKINPRIQIFRRMP